MGVDFIKMSALTLILLTTLIQTGTLGCFLYDIDYKGTNLNSEHSIRTEDAATCQKMCQNNPQCYFWTWASPEFHDSNYRKDCYLKSSDVSMTSDNGLVSGPKNCGQEDCCESFNIETVGMGNFYQEERLGDFFKVGNSQNGRNVYRQKNGDNYLFYLQAQGYWMIGKNIGQDMGGVLNRGASFCPEDSTSLWEYWNDWQKEWDEDSFMEITCDGDNPDPNPTPGPGGCASGPVCDTCNIWASVNDVKYCCATNCNYGYVEVSSSNGVVVCNCYQK